MSETKRLVSRRSLLGGSLAAAMVVPAVAMPARFAGQIYPGASVASLPLGGLTPEEADEKLRVYMASYEQHAATLVFQDNLWPVTLSELGGTVNYSETVAGVMRHGRTSLSDRYVRFFDAEGSEPFPLVIDWNASVAAEYLESIAPAIDITARNARLYRNQDGIQIVDSVEGRALDRERSLRDIEIAVQSHTLGDIELKTNVVAPGVTTEALAQAKDQAIRLIGDQVVLKHGELNYPISAEQLAQALVIDKRNQPSIDPARLTERLDAIQWDVYEAPINAQFGWDNGLHLVARETDGLELDREATEKLVVSLAESEERAAELPMRVAKARARKDNMKELGLETHLAYGSSSFAGSSWERATNVAVAASHISYKLVAPGEQFSFNQLLGPITEEMGYVSGTIISGDWTATDIGGGVCQVSTTVFRAAARAGFQFSEWHPHTWRLGFYEIDGSPPGFDAAIYQPNGPGQMTLDLTFTNTLDSWLLLMMVVDGTTVSAHFYGKDPGWDVEFGAVLVSDPIQPGKAVERENTGLARGERRWVSGSAPGYTVVLPRTVTAADGTVISNGEFVSNYLAQPETWEVGPR